MKLKIVYFFIILVQISCSRTESEKFNTLNLDIKEGVNQYLKNYFGIDTIYHDIKPIRKFSDSRFNFYMAYLNPDFSFDEYQREPVVVLYDKKQEIYVHEKKYCWDTFSKPLDEKKGFVFNLFSDTEYRALKYKVMHTSKEANQQNFIYEYLQELHSPFPNNIESISLDSALSIINKYEDRDEFSSDIIEWFNIVHLNAAEKSNFYCMREGNLIFIYDFVEFYNKKSVSTIRTFRFQW